MNTINVATANTNLIEMMDYVNDNSSPMTLVNPDGKNAVLIGLEDWNALQETIYLNSVHGMAESLIKGKATPLEECLSEDEVQWQQIEETFQACTHGVSIYSIDLCMK